MQIQCFPKTGFMNTPHICDYLDKQIDLSQKYPTDWTTLEMLFSNETWKEFMD